jgi:DNA polymerase III alpha subunit
MDDVNAMGINVLEPDVNESELTFTVKMVEIYVSD